MTALGEDSFRALQVCPSCDGTGDGEVTSWWPATRDEPSCPRHVAPCAECDGTGYVSEVLADEPEAEPEARFRTDEMQPGEPDVPLSTMLEDNAEDEWVCDWLRNAQVGDVLDEVVIVTRVA